MRYETTYEFTRDIMFSPHTISVLVESDLASRESNAAHPGGDSLHARSLEAEVPHCRGLP